MIRFLRLLLKNLFGGPPEIKGKRSPQWARVRAKHLRREPRCAACGGNVYLQVHHIEPYHLHPELELKAANLITLCERPGHNCHFRYGHFLNWKRYNPNVRLDAAAFLKAMKLAPRN